MWRHVSTHRVIIRPIIETCLYICYTVHHIIIYLSNLDTHIQYSVVLLDKIPLHVSGWLAHHQEVQMCTVHAATSPFPTVATTTY